MFVPTFRNDYLVLSRPMRVQCVRKQQQQNSRTFIKVFTSTSSISSKNELSAKTKPNLWSFPFFFFLMRKMPSNTIGQSSTGGLKPPPHPPPVLADHYPDDTSLQETPAEPLRIFTPPPQETLSKRHFFSDKSVLTSYLYKCPNPPTVR